MHNLYRLVLYLSILHYAWCMSLVGFQESTPISYVNGQLVASPITQYTLTVSCRNGETSFLEGITDQNTPANVFVNCSGIARNVIKTLVGYTPISAQVYVADSYQSILIAESRSTNALYDTAVAYAQSRQFQPVASSRRRGAPDIKNKPKRSSERRSSTPNQRKRFASIYYGPTTISSTADLEAALGEAEQNGFDVSWGSPAAGIEVYANDLDSILSQVLEDSLPSADNDLSGIYNGNTNLQSQCNTFFSNGVGINGLRGCLYQLISVVNGYQSEIVLDEQAIKAEEGQIQSLFNILTTVQEDITAVVVSVTDLAQQLANTLKTVSAGAYIQQTADLTSGGIIATIEDAASTQNQNNQNIQTIIQENQQTNTLAESTLENQLNALSQQTQDQITLVATELVQKLAVVYAELSQSIQQSSDLQALKDASAYAQITNALNNILSSNQYTGNVIQIMNSKFADAYQAISDLAVSATTVDTLCIDTYKSLSLAIDTAGLIPFISDWGTPPPDTNTTTLWGTRVFSLNYPRILNTQTGLLRTCQTPFGVGQPWKAELNTLISTEVPITVNIPSNMDLNLPIYSDYVYLQVLVNGVWNNLSYTSCSASCTNGVNGGTFVICPTTSTIRAIGFRLQNYGWYSTRLTNGTSTFPATNVYPGDQIYLDGQDVLTGYLLQAAVQVPLSSSNNLVVTQPASLNTLSIANVFNIQLNSSSGYQSYQAIRNTTEINLVSAATGNPIYLSSNKCFLSSPSGSSIPAPAVFRIVSVNGKPAQPDTGIPDDTRKRNLKAKPTQVFTEEDSTEFFSRERRSSVTCSSVFGLQTSGSARNQTAINLCTAVQGCVLARFQRIDQVTISTAQSPLTSPANSYVNYTLGIGTYNLAATADATANGQTSNGLFVYGQIPITACEASYYKQTYFNLQITAGLRFGIHMQIAGVTTSRYITSMVEDTSYTVAVTATGILTENSNTDICTSGGSAWITVDYEPSYPVFNYFDVCMPNAQSSGPLTSGACSVLSTVPYFMEIPQIYQVYMNIELVTIGVVGITEVTYPAFAVGGITYPAPFEPPTLISGYATQVNGLTTTHISNGGTVNIAGWAGFNILNDGSLYTTLTTSNGLVYTYSAGSFSPFTCFANCLDVGTDRASCIELDYDRCAWWYNATTNSNQCEPLSGTVYTSIVPYINPSFTVTITNVNGNSQTVLASQVSYTTTRCPNNGPVQSFVLTGFQVNGFTAVCGDTQANADKLYESYTVIQNSGCSSSYTITNPLTVEIEAYPDIETRCSATVTFNSLTISASPTTNVAFSCNSVTLGQDTYHNVQYDPAAYVCNQVSTQLVILNGYYWQSSVIPSYDISHNVAFGAFVDESYLNYPIPACVWNPATASCQNFDIQYSNSVTDVIYCAYRLLQADNLGACITSPTNEIVYQGISYTPRCAYVLPYGSAAGQCVTYAFDNTPAENDLSKVVPPIGPYNVMFSSVGNGISLLEECLSPGNQCYFETTAAIPSTTAWYQGINAATQNPYYNSDPGTFCQTYNSDSLGCPLKTFVGGNANCTYYSNGLCAANCPAYNHNPVGCANNLPYNYCYYNKNTGLCQTNTINYLSLTGCGNYNCFSASTICYAYSTNPTACEANSLCIWMNIAGDTNSSYCDIQQNVQDPECLNSAGTYKSYCNVTYDQGLSALIASVTSSCNIASSLSFDAYMSTCVTLYDTSVTPQVHCVYVQFGPTIQFCKSPSDPSINSYSSQFGSFLPVSITTFAQYAASQAPESSIYTMPFAYLPIRSTAGITIGNMRNAGITLIPDDPSSFFACVNTSYTAVGQYCCLTTEVVASPTNQCGPTYYDNPYHPSSLMQIAYATLCENELGTHEQVVLEQIDFPIYTAGITEPLPGQPGYTLDSQFCPSFSNGTDFPEGYVGNYSMYAYLLSEQSQDLWIGPLQGQSECLVYIEVNNTEVQLVRLGAASWAAYANALTIALYNGTLYNVTYFGNFSSHLLLSGNIDVNYKNMTTDFPTLFYNTISSDVQYWIDDYSVRYGPQVSMWGCQIPGGITVSKKYIQGLSSNTYSTIGNEAVFGAVSAETLPVYKALSYIDVMGATVVVTNPNDEEAPAVVYSPINYIVNYDNINLLPAINQAWVFGNVGDYVYSPPYSSSTPCQGLDFMSITSDASNSNPFNYTTAVARCPFFDPKWFQNNIGAFTCFRNAAIPPDEIDFQGVQFGPSYEASTNVQYALSLSLLIYLPIVDSNGETLYQWWNNTLSTDGTTAVLVFVNALQAEWNLLGCPKQLVNYINPSTLAGINSTQTAVIGLDFFRPIYIAYKAALVNLGHNATASQAIASIASTYLVPTINTFSNAYCGNCGLQYATTCIPTTQFSVRSATYSCQNGISYASSAFDISFTDTIDTYLAHDGTAELLLTFQVNQINQLENVETLACPSAPNNLPFSCDASLGFVYCTFSATNNVAQTNIDVIFSIVANGSIAACSIQQTNTIAPGNTYSSQFNLCEDTVNTLTIQRTDGYVCYSSIQVIGNYTSTTSITDLITQSVLTTVYNGTTTSLTNALFQLDQTNTNIGTLGAQVFALNANITFYQSLLNTQYQEFLNYQNTIGRAYQQQNFTLATIVGQYGNLTLDYILPLTTNYSALAGAIGQQLADEKQLQADIAAILASLDNTTAGLIAITQYIEEVEANQTAIYENYTITADNLISQFGKYTYTQQTANVISFEYFEAFCIAIGLLIIIIIVLLIYLITMVCVNSNRRMKREQQQQDYRLQIRRDPKTGLPVDDSTLGMDTGFAELMKAIKDGQELRYIDIPKRQLYPPFEYGALVRARDAQRKASKKIKPDEKLSPKTKPSSTPGVQPPPPDYDDTTTLAKQSSVVRTSGTQIKALNEDFNA